MNLPVLSLPARVAGYNDGVAIDMGEKPRIIPCADYEQYLALEENFPQRIVIDLQQQLAHIRQDKVLGVHASYYCLKAAIDACLFALPSSLDMLDSLNCHIEQAVDNYVEEASSNGFMPPCEDDGAEFTLNLTGLLVDFSMRVMALFLHSNLPVVQTIGCPYEVEGISPSGKVLLNKMQSFRMEGLLSL